jgi:hypothetical protein
MTEPTPGITLLKSSTNPGKIFSGIKHTIYAPASTSDVSPSSYSSAAIQEEKDTKNPKKKD